MEILIENIHRSSITLHFTQDFSEGLDEITPLVKSLEKVKGIVNEVGFTNKFTKEERELWNHVYEELNGRNNFQERVVE